MRTKRWGGGPATLVLIDRTDEAVLFVIEVEMLKPEDLDRLRRRADAIGIDVRLVDFPVAHVADERGVEDVLRGYEQHL